MAVYYVSLKRLGDARQRLRQATKPDTETVPDSGAGAPATPTSTTTAPTATNASAPPEVATSRPRRTRKRAKAPTKRSATAPAASSRSADSADGEAGDALAATVEELLHLPREQVRELLAGCNEPTRKVLLAMIYRLAAVEDELHAVAGRVRRGGAAALQPAVFRAPQAEGRPGADKSGLLEQVFKKNLTLRKRK